MGRALFLEFTDEFFEKLFRLDFLLILCRFLGMFTPEFLFLFYFLSRTFSIGKIFCTPFPDSPVCLNKSDVA